MSGGRRFLDYMRRKLEPEPMPAFKNSIWNQRNKPLTPPYDGEALESMDLDDAETYRRNGALDCVVTWNNLYGVRP